VGIRVHVEKKTTSGDTKPVRCLECGNIYQQPQLENESRPCPACGYVGWVALRMEQRERELSG
jgi:predicted Zn-ribbon and HTH transcriptional regulator